MDNLTLTYELKELLGESSLKRMVACLSDVCRQQASLFKTDWPDKLASQQWDKAAKVLDTIPDQLASYPGIE